MSKKELIWDEKPVEVISVKDKVDGFCVKCVFHKYCDAPKNIVKTKWEKANKLKNCIDAKTEYRYKEEVKLMHNGRAEEDVEICKITITADAHALHITPYTIKGIFSDETGKKILKRKYRTDGGDIITAFNKAREMLKEASANRLRRLIGDGAKFKVIKGNCYFGGTIITDLYEHEIETHPNVTVKDTGCDFSRGMDKDDYPDMGKPLYELLQDFTDPNGTVKKGTRKDKYQWCTRFALLNHSDLDTKTDWFKKVKNESDLTSEEIDNLVSLLQEVEGLDSVQVSGVYYRLCLNCNGVGILRLHCARCDGNGMIPVDK